MLRLLPPYCRRRCRGRWGRQRVAMGARAAPLQPPPASCPRSRLPLKRCLRPCRPAGQRTQLRRWGTRRRQQVGGTRWLAYRMSHWLAGAARHACRGGPFTHNEAVPVRPAWRHPVPRLIPHPCCSVRLPPAAADEDEGSEEEGGEEDEDEGHTEEEEEEHEAYTDEEVGGWGGWHSVASPHLFVPPAS